MQQLQLFHTHWEVDSLAISANWKRVLTTIYVYWVVMLGSESSARLKFSEKKNSGLTPGL